MYELAPRSTSRPSGDWSTIMSMILADSPRCSTSGLTSAFRLPNRKPRYDSKRATLVRSWEPSQLKLSG
ncbi:hypothetical protein D3C81_2220600 [compost metagenome]